MHETETSEDTRRADPAACVRTPVLLGWTDPVTGDELALEVQGSPDFLSELQALGFVVLGPRPGVKGVDGAGAGDRMGEACVGANSTWARGRLGRSA